MWLYDNPPKLHSMESSSSVRLSDDEAIMKNGLETRQTLNHSFIHILKAMLLDLFHTVGKYVVS